MPKIGGHDKDGKVVPFYCGGYVCFVVGEHGQLELPLFSVALGR